MAEDTKPPNQELAMQICRELGAEGLISPEHLSDLEAKLKSGGVGGEDWHKWVKHATNLRKATDDSHG